MKVNNGFRNAAPSGDPDEGHRGVKLAPMKKSGKTKHQIYNSDEDEWDDQEEYYTKRESVLDYFDDEEEDDL